MKSDVLDVISSDDLNSLTESFCSSQLTRLSLTDSKVKSS